MNSALLSTLVRSGVLAALLLSSDGLPAVAQEMTPQQRAAVEVFVAATKAEQAGRFDEAEALFKKSLMATEVLYGKDDYGVGIVSKRFGIHYSNRGRWKDAEVMQSNAIRIFSRSKPIPAELAPTLRDLGITKLKLGSSAEAAAHFRRCLSVYEQRFGRHHEDVGATASLLASALAAQGKLLEAAEMFGYSDSILQQLPKADPMLRPVMLTNLAGLLKNAAEQKNEKNRRDLGAMSEERYKQALQLFESNAAIRDSEAHAAAVNGLAGLYMEQDRLNAAEPLMNRSTIMLERLLGPKHPDLAPALNNLAQLHVRQGQPDKAEPLFLRSLEIWESGGTTSHTHVSTVHNSLGEMYVGQGRRDEALPQLNEARRVLQRVLLRELPRMSYDEQRRLLDGTGVETSDLQSLMTGLTFALKYRDQPAVVEASAEWLINGKAITLDARKLTEAPVPAATDLWVSLASLREALPDDGVLVDFYRLRPRRFGKGSIHDRWGPPRYVAWIIPAAEAKPVAVVDLGPAAEIDAAIEGVRGVLRDTVTRLTDTDGEPFSKVVGLLPDVHGPLKAVSDKVWLPLSAHVGDSSSVVLSPDGELWLIPWAALPTKTDRYLIEKRTLNFVVSGRDLVPNGPTADSSAPAVVVADPDYDAAPVDVLDAAGGARRRALLGPEAELPLSGKRFEGQLAGHPFAFWFTNDREFQFLDGATGADAGTGTWSINGEGLQLSVGNARYLGRYSGGRVSGEQTWIAGGRVGTKSTWSFDVPMAMSLGLGLEPRETRRQLPRFPALSGTAREAKKTAAHLRKWTGQAPEMHLRAGASESAVKSVDSPQSLVMATHGFFFPAESPANQDSPDRQGAGTVDDSLLRCGLVFAGVNRREQMRPGDNDGILTGAEILRLRLKGTRLVVLSACETGLGDIHTGQGVSGLRQAFHLAGAKSVMATLWSVSDGDPTLDLLDNFYTEAIAGKTNAEALAIAQRSMIRSKAGTGFGHPFFWAAFTVTDSRRNY